MENWTNASEPLDSNIFDETIEAGPTRPLVVLAQCTILLFGTAGNLLVLILMIKNKKLQTLSNSFVVALALADLDNCLLISCIHLLIIVAPNIANENKVICIFISLEPVAMTCLSFLSLASLTTERFIAVYFPFEHLRWVNRRSVGVTITLCGIYAFLVGFSPSFNISDPMAFNLRLVTCQGIRFSITACLYIFYGVWLPAISVIVISYGLISKAALKQAKRLPVMKIKDKAYKHALNVSKSVKVFIVIALGMSLIWVPYILFSTIFLLHPKATEMPWLHLIIIILNNLGRGMSAVNPWIFVLRNKSFHECLKELTTRNRKSNVSKTSGSLDLLT